MLFFKKKYFLHNKGYCPICEKKVVFRSKVKWLRDNYFCSGCGSVPRERALMHVIQTHYPNYRELSIHESSPCSRGTSPKLMKECKKYSASQYYKDIPSGELHPDQGVRSENLEQMTFENESFDLFVTQDVMEHVFNPEKAFSEIARVLKPGGAHVFTVPLINENEPTEVWASLDESGEIIYHHEAEYHGNPIDDKGALVTMHWGTDIREYITSVSGLPTEIITIDDLEMGIRAKYIEVVISRKPV